jgi:hypothetical protein
LLEDPPPSAMAELVSHATSVVRTGDWLRLEISEESEVPKVLQIVLRHGTRIVSLSPVKKSLEDYFLAQVSASEGTTKDKAVPLPAR